jgi:hypothetical protein
LSGSPPQPTAEPIRWRIGSTASLLPKVCAKPASPRAQAQECVAGRVEAGRVVVESGERASRSGVHVQLVLQGVHGREVGGVVGVDEGSHRDTHVVGVEAIDGELVFPGVVDHVVDVVVVVDDHRRQVAVAGIGQRQRRALGDVDECPAVQGVAVHADHGLLSDRHRLAAMVEHVDRRTPCERSEHPVRLSTHEVVDVYRGSHRPSLTRPHPPESSAAFRHRLAPRVPTCPKPCGRGGGSVREDVRYCSASAIVGAANMPV